MATKNKSQIFPVITQNEFDLADACARELWRGYNYSNESPIISDEILFAWFGNPFIDLQKNKATNLHIYSECIDRFITIIDMPKIRNNQTLDIENGILTLQYICRSDYAKWIRDNAKKINTISKYDLVINMTIKTANGFFRPYNRIRNGSFYPLATRILFFAAPNLPIYNLSEKICAALKLKPVRTEEAFINFYHLMNKIAEDNWEKLCNYKMPLSNGNINDKYWLIAAENGWWQRRVLDLALMINKGNIKNKKFIKQIVTTKTNNLKIFNLI